MPLVVMRHRTLKSLKILQITSASSFGGGERYVVDLTNALFARGHELFVAVRPGSPLLPLLDIPLDHVKTLPLRNALDVQSAQQLARFVKQHEINVVHAHMARDYPVAAYSARGSPSTKFFITRHVLFPLHRIHRRTLARASRVIAVSQAVARHLRSQSLVSDDRIAIVPNGVDVGRFSRALQSFDKEQFLRRNGLPLGQMMVGSIGELRPLKRHDDFLRAVAIVSRDVRDSHFVVAGIDTSSSAENRKQLVQLASDLGLNDRVHFLGWLDDAEQLLLTLDLLVSASETESFGLAIAEAMAAETAVVATATEGAREVVQDGETGLIVPIGDVDQMAKAITLLLRDANKRKEFGTRGRQVVSERFNLERMVRQIEDIYSS